MAKFFGKIGFSETVETTPGIWEPRITVREYYGDVNRNQRRWQENPDSQNDDLNLSNEISIVGDPYAYDNFNAMKWVEYGGAKWKISWINLQYPRIILTLGGVYNGKDENELESDQDAVDVGDAAD